MKQQTRTLNTLQEKPSGKSRHETNNHANANNSKRHEISYAKANETIITMNMKEKKHITYK